MDYKVGVVIGSSYLVILISGCGQKREEKV